MTFVIVVPDGMKHDLQLFCGHQYELLNESHVKYLTTIFYFYFCKEYIYKKKNEFS